MGPPGIAQRLRAGASGAEHRQSGPRACKGEPQRSGSPEHCPTDRSPGELSPKHGGSLKCHLHSLSGPLHLLFELMDATRYCTKHL